MDAYRASSLAWLGLSLGAPALAWFSDRIKSRVRPMAAAAFVQLIAIIGILVRADASAGESSVWFFLLGFAAGGSMIPFTIASELVSTAYVGTSASIVNGTQFLVGGLMMAVPGRVLSGVGLVARLHTRVGNLTEPPVGTISDYRWAIALMPIALCIALLLCSVLKETFPGRAEARG